jgi:endonuclease III
MGQAEIVDRLLREHGRTFSSEAGIRVPRDQPAPLFQLLCLSLLISARISHDIAMRASIALRSAGWTTPRAMVESTWEERTRVLDEAGYARYDERTARYLDATAQRLLDHYGGDLRTLRRGAAGDVTVLRDGLTSFTGIGAVGASFFLREVQVVWHELVPFVDDRTCAGARRLGLPDDASRPWCASSCRATADLS